MDFTGFANYTDLEKDRWRLVEMREGDLIEPGTIIDATAKIYGIVIDGQQLINIGKNCYIGPQVYLRGHITIGDMSWLGPNCAINGEGGCVIGKGVGLGNSCIILTCEHQQSDINQPISFGELVKNSVIIEDGANIGVGSIILPGCHIGIGAQIGAGSVVTKNTVVLNHEIWAGNPAKCIGTRKTPKEL